MVREGRAPSNLQRISSSEFGSERFMRHRLPHVGLHFVFLWVLISAWTLFDPAIGSGAEVQKSVLLIY